VVLEPLRLFQALQLLMLAVAVVVEQALFPEVLVVEETVVLVLRLIMGLLAMLIQVEEVAGMVAP
jgi:hypothetical protein